MPEIVAKKGMDQNRIAAAAELLAMKEFRDDLERVREAAAVSRADQPTLMTQGAQDVQRTNFEKLFDRTVQLYFLEEKRVLNSQRNIKVLKDYAPESAVFVDADSFKLYLSKVKNMFNEVYARHHSSGLHSIDDEADQEMLDELVQEAREDEAREGEERLPAVDKYVKKD